MKFITTVTALAALFPIIALAADPTAEAEEVIDLDDKVPTETLNIPAADITTAIPGIDYEASPPDEPALNERDLEDRATKQSDLTIQLYRNKGCSGPSFEVEARYDTGYKFRIQSYKTSRTMKLGEVLSFGWGKGVMSLVGSRGFAESDVA
ncbi:MAG: hypothetical protein LQ337_002154 [Flavoplaca oasis]|nr:MAG: hypothetical protein LQ337_002154 [Flavoplaca oasis]